MGLAAPLSRWLAPYADQLHISFLPAHLPTILRSLLLWTALQYLSSGLSPRLFPKTFAKFNKKTRTSWDIHFVAFCHAVVITPLCARVWWKVRNEAHHPLAVDRLYGYDYQAGEVYAIALGYFLWDSVISILHEGPGFVAHGLVAMTAFVMVYHPIFMYDGLGFLLWELSTPFLNIHWFLDKLGKTGSTMQLVNAAFLLSSYIGARLTFGVYNSISWARFVVAPNTPHHPAIPAHMYWFYLLGNVTLNSLNFFWFRAMVRAVQKRFTADPKPNQIDPRKLASGEQKVKFGVQGTSDDQFEQEAGVSRKSQ